jgi:predicted glycosyltransferase
MARVLIAVTHLLGSGHLVRARHLARALAAAGHQVTLASGGMTLRAEAEGGFDVVQLPPVKVEGVDFRNLLDEAGRPIDTERRTARLDALVGLASAIRPDIVITEHFPFGRRQLADEFLGLIAAARAANRDVLVLSSIRDVLVAPRADRVAEAEARLAAHFDGVLVHGDAAFLPLEASWPVAPDLAGRLFYTGYLTAPSLRGGAADEAIQGDVEPDEAGLLRCARNDGEDEILVSGGGSAAALPLFRRCLDAARLLGPSRSWRMLVGRGTDVAEYEALRAAAADHVTVEWARPDFPALLGRCALSISQAGYNTVLDLVAARRPAIVVPFDAGNETEQAIRAEAMAKAGLAHCLRMTGAEALTPAHLAEAVSAVLAAGAPAAAAINRDGATKAVAIVAELLAGRSGNRS